MSKMEDTLTHALLILCSYSDRVVTRAIAFSQWKVIFIAQEEGFQTSLKCYAKKNKSSRSPLISPALQEQRGAEGMFIFHFFTTQNPPQNNFFLSQ